MRSRALLAFGLAGCFGAGDPPTPPAKATSIFAIPEPATGQECNGAAYIGAVGFGTTRGYYIGLPYYPNGCNNGGGSAPSEAEVTSFDLTGADPATTSLGTAGVVGPGTELPQIAVAGDTPSWVFEQSMMNQLEVAIGSPASPIAIATTMADGPAGIVVGADGTTLIAAQVRQMTSTSFEDPQYPCCGAGLGAPANLRESFVAVIPPAGTASTRIPVTLRLSCDTLDSCLVANTTNVFVMEHAPTTGAQVRRFAKTATSDADVMPVAQITTDVLRHAVPVGMAADDTGLVFATSQDPTVLGDVPGCEIRRYDLQTLAVTTLLSTTSFWCQDVAIDNAAAYFAITEIAASDGDTKMRGVGIGRVGFDGTLSTIRLGMTGSLAGPRRIHVDAGYLYAVDPFVIGRIATQDLAGHEDFAP